MAHPSTVIYQVNKRSLLQPNWLKGQAKTTSGCISSWYLLQYINLNQYKRSRRFGVGNLLKITDEDKKEPVLGSIRRTYLKRLPSGLIDLWIGFIHQDAINLQNSWRHARSIKRSHDTPGVVSTTVNYWKPKALWKHLPPKTAKIGSA